MKTIQFHETSEYKEYFQMIHSGFLTGVPDGGIKGLSARRTVSKIIDKLDAISHPEKKDGEILYYRSGDEVRTLNDGGGTLELEDTEYEMLKAHFESALPSFRTGASRKVVEAADLLGI